MATQSVLQSRSPHRVPDETWRATIRRVRGEFEEMPGMRVTVEEASALLGLPPPVSTWILEKLTEEGFLCRTGRGEYLRRTDSP